MLINYDCRLRSTSTVSKATLTLRTCTRVHVRGRKTLQFRAVVKYMLIIMVYCAILRDTAWSCSKNHATLRTNRAQLDLCVKARACTCVAAISVSAVIEINVFDYNANVRARAWTCVRLRTCTCVVWVRLNSDNGRWYVVADPPPRSAAKKSASPKNKRT